MVNPIIFVPLLHPFTYLARPVNNGGGRFRFKLEGGWEDRAEEVEKGINNTMYEKSHIETYHFISPIYMYSLK